MARRSFTIALLPLAALLGFTAPALSAATADRETARFGLCSGPGRVTCVVDGDTFWYRGQKIRIADINAPEVSHPGCAREAALGKAATGRLVALLNSGPFSLALDPADPGRDHDRYGRLLRTVTRAGASVGGALVREGLAERWKGYRGDWCRNLAARDLGFLFGDELDQRRLTGLDRR